MVSTLSWFKVRSKKKLWFVARLCVELTLEDPENFHSSTRTNVHVGELLNPYIFTLSTHLLFRSNFKSAHVEGMFPCSVLSFAIWSEFLSACTVMTFKRPTVS